MAHVHQRQFISALRAQLGTPYVWGGAAPGGFDCSGLVYWAARQAGIRGVPRTSQQQFRVGTPVPMNGLRPGDLVFMNYEGVGATHVGIYVGNGQILEAPHTGDVVKTLPVSAFAGHILGARRILANPGGQVMDSSRFAAAQTQYHQQQTGGGQAGPQQNPAKTLAALSLLHQSAQTQLRPLNLPTAQGTLQRALAPYGPKPQQPLLPTFPQPLVAIQRPDPLGQLTAIHDRLIRP